MKYFNATLILIVCFLLISEKTTSQNQDNTIISLSEIYNKMIPNEVSSTKNIIGPISNNTLIGTDKEGSVSVINSTLINDIVNDFKSNWEHLIFNDLDIKEVEEGNILVTGFLIGKNYEQGLVNYQPFQHTWLIQNGIVVKFID
ncbi:hypothetical protein [Xanthomarina sp. GH4-25]|uniref:hypothetical protein n=1 Tax=Xanthomarina sp. GH4-25 TaxID=3349335 RepID=UPI000D67A0D7|nr:hypothetical protein DI383_08015 [Flavobacteriaceae bacterium LYZ1037]